MVRYPVLELDSSAVVSALDTVNRAIKRAYDATSADLLDKGYDRRIKKTAYSQVLHHNINQEVFDTGGKDRGLVTDLPPNPRRSHHHVIITVKNVLMTVSAVTARHRVPRRATHRSRYALRQTYFRVEGTGFTIVPVPDPHDPHAVYLQLLHGPDPVHHERHGFTVVRMLDTDNQYLPDIIDLDEHLASIATVETDHEQVTEDFQVTVVAREVGGQNALW